VYVVSQVRRCLAGPGRKTKHASLKSTAMNFNIKPRYRKDDRALRPICECPENCT